jgi:hypothetical protein
VTHARSLPSRGNSTKRSRPRSESLSTNGNQRRHDPDKPVHNQHVLAQPPHPPPVYFVLLDTDAPSL